MAEQTLTIPADHDGLLVAAKKILSPKSADVILEGIKMRKKWSSIQDQYKVLVSRGVRSKEAIPTLAACHHYSEKTIQAIIYER